MANLLDDNEPIPEVEPIQPVQQSPVSASSFIALPKTEIDQYGNPSDNQKAAWQTAEPEGQEFKGYEKAPSGEYNPIYLPKRNAEIVQESTSREQGARNRRIDDSTQRVNDERNRRRAIREYSTEFFVKNMVAQGVAGMKLGADVGEDVSGLTSEILNDPLIMNDVFLQNFSKREMQNFEREESGQTSTFSKRSLADYQEKRKDFTDRIRQITGKRQGELYRKEQFEAKERAIASAQLAYTERLLSVRDKAEARVLKKQNAALQKQTTRLNLVKGYSDQLQTVKSGKEAWTFMGLGGAVSPFDAERIAKAYIAPQHQEEFKRGIEGNWAMLTQSRIEQLNALRPDGAGTIGTTQKRQMGTAFSEVRSLKLPPEKELEIVAKAANTDKKNPAAVSEYIKLKQTPTKEDQTAALENRDYDTMQTTKLNDRVSAIQGFADTMIKGNRQAELVDRMLVKNGTPGQQSVFANKNTTPELRAFVINYMKKEINDETLEMRYLDSLTDENSDASKGIDAIVSALEGTRKAADDQERIKEEQYRSGVIVANPGIPKINQNLMVEDAGGQTISIMNPYGKDVEDQLRVATDTAMESKDPDIIAAFKKGLGAFGANSNILGKNIETQNGLKAFKRLNLIPLKPAALAIFGDALPIAKSLSIYGGKPVHNIMVDASKGGSFSESFHMAAEPEINTIKKINIDKGFDIKLPEATQDSTKNGVRNYYETNYGAGTAFEKTIFAPLAYSNKKELVEAVNARLKTLKNEDLKPAYELITVSDKSPKIGALIAEKIKSERGTRIRALANGGTSSSFAAAYFTASRDVIQDSQEQIITLMSELDNIQRTQAVNGLKGLGLAVQNQKTGVVSQIKTLPIAWRDLASRFTGSERDVYELVALSDLTRDYYDSSKTKFEKIEQHQLVLAKMNSFSRNPGSSSDDDTKTHYTALSAIKKRHLSIVNAGDVMMEIASAVDKPFATSAIWRKSIRDAFASSIPSTPIREAGRSLSSSDLIERALPLLGDESIPNTWKDQVAYTKLGFARDIHPELRKARLAESAAKEEARLKLHEERVARLKN